MCNLCRIFIVLACRLCKIFYSACLQVVQEYERAVIFRLGRLQPGGAKGPGIIIIVVIIIVLLIIVISIVVIIVVIIVIIINFMQPWGANRPCLFIIINVSFLSFLSY